jgi:hypothetical protein
MPNMKLAFKINILKMEQAFQMGYRQGEKVFFVSPTNCMERRLLFQAIKIPKVPYGGRKIMSLRIFYKKI